MGKQGGNNENKFLIKEMKNEFRIKVQDIIVLYRLRFNNYSVGDIERCKLNKIVNWYENNKEIENQSIIDVVATFYFLFITKKPFIRNNHYMALFLTNTILTSNGLPPVVIPMERRIEMLNNCELSKVRDIIGKQIRDRPVMKRKVKNIY